MSRLSRMTQMVHSGYQPVVGTPLIGTIYSRLIPVQIDSFVQFDAFAYFLALNAKSKR